MAKKLVQHVTLEPEWPEWGFVLGPGEDRTQDRRIRLGDVEDTFTIESGERENVYFLWADYEGVERREFLWRGTPPYEVDDETGEVAGPFDTGPDVPRMTRRELESLGHTDEDLQLERQRLLGRMREGDLALNSSLPDSLALQAERYRVWDRIMAVWHADPRSTDAPEVSL